MLNSRVANGIPSVVNIPYICYRCQLTSSLDATRIARRRFHTSPSTSLSRSSNTRESEKITDRDTSIEVALSVSEPGAKKKQTSNAQRAISTEGGETSGDGVDTQARGKVRSGTRKPRAVKKTKEKSWRTVLSQEDLERTKKRSIAETSARKKALAKLEYLRAKTSGKIGQDRSLRKHSSSSSSSSSNPRVRKSTSQFEDIVLEEVGIGGSGFLGRLKGHKTLEEALTKTKKSQSEHGPASKVKTGDVALKALDVERKPVPRLAYGLSRALFNPGILEMRDLRSRVFNFDPYLEKIVPVAEFDFSTLKQFTTASKDPTLENVARKLGKKYIGSSSSMTGLLKHFHYLLSAWREPSLKMLSASFPAQEKASFTKIQKGPEVGFLRWKDGVYALDSDKQYDRANILSMMGQYMEKLLTVNKEVFERHRVGKSHLLSEEERSTVDSYHYSNLGDFVMRSQLDAYDPRLPGTGMFDLKTRAVLPIRMDTRDFQPGMDYEIKQHHGEFSSFELRMGRMDGIYVAYHNIYRIFGFQYISLAEIDEALHGQPDPCLGDQEFAFSLHILNDLLNKATKRFPEQSLRVHIETRSGVKPFMYFFAEPVTEEQVDAIQNLNKAEIERWEKEILGLDVNGNKLRNENESSGEVITDGNNPQNSKLVSSEAATQRTSNATSTSPEFLADDSSSATDHGFPEVSEKMGKPEQRATTSEEMSGPLFAAIITSESYIDDSHQARPMNLTSEQQWELRYDIAEVERPEKAWQLYMACKRRRQELHGPDAHGTEKGNRGGFMDRIKRATEEGRQWRADMDAKDKGKPIRLWNDELVDQAEMVPVETHLHSGIEVSDSKSPDQRGPLTTRILNTIKNWTGNVNPARTTETTIIASLKPRPIPESSISFAKAVPVKSASEIFMERSTSMADVSSADPSTSESHEALISNAIPARTARNPSIDSKYGDEEVFSSRPTMEEAENSVQYAPLERREPRVKSAGERFNDVKMKCKGVETRVKSMQYELTLVSYMLSRPVIMNGDGSSKSMADGAGDLHTSLQTNLQKDKLDSSGMEKKVETPNPFPELKAASDSRLPNSGTPLTAPDSTASSSSMKEERVDYRALRKERRKIAKLFRADAVAASITEEKRLVTSTGAVAKNPKNSADFMSHRNMSRFFNRVETKTHAIMVKSRRVRRKLALIRKISESGAKKVDEVMASAQVAPVNAVILDSATAATEEAGVQAK